jgi:hypothetical protein
MGGETLFDCQFVYVKKVGKLQDLFARHEFAEAIREA